MGFLKFDGQPAAAISVADLADDTQWVSSPGTARLLTTTGSKSLISPKPCFPGLSLATNIQL